VAVGSPQSRELLHKGDMVVVRGRFYMNNGSQVSGRVYPETGRLAGTLTCYGWSHYMAERVAVRGARTASTSGARWDRQGRRIGQPEFGDDE